MGYSVWLYINLDTLVTWVQCLCGFPPVPPVSGGRGPVGVVQHGVEGAGEVVADAAAGVALGERDETGQQQEQQQEHVEGEGGPEDPVEEGARRRRRLPPLSARHRKQGVISFFNRAV